MNKFPLMVAAMLAAGIVNAEEMELDAEGQLTLGEEQLQAIEQAFAANKTEELTQQLTEANQNLATANETIAERDATITEQTTQIENLKNGAGASTTTVVDDPAGASHEDDGLSQESVDLYNAIAN